MTDLVKKSYGARQRAADYIRYHIALAKIRWYGYWEDDSAGSPDLVSHFRACMKDIAKEIEPLAKRLGKTRELEQRLPFL